MKHFVVAITTSIVLTFALTVPAQAVTYGGDATGAEVVVTATGTTIRAATGTLSISGGMAEASLLVGDIPSGATGGAVALTASALHSAVVGVGNATNAEASMGAISLTVSGNTLSADFLMARSKASCGPGPAVAGSSELTNLVINGTSITVTGAANQTVSLPNGTAIINAQTSSVGGSAGELAVSALRVLTHDTITGQPIADAALSTIDAKVDCAAGGSATETWVTGGGWITGFMGGKATFGFVAGQRADGTFRGHLTYKDHSSGTTFQGNVSDFVFCNVNQSEFTATGNSNTGPSSSTAQTQDNAEPGRLMDVFNIQIITDGYVHGGTLQGGNIQNHGFTCP
jgi:hypothetical protein